MALRKDIFWLRRSSLSSGYPFPSKRFIPALWVNAQDTTDVVAITRDGKLTVGISPFIEEVANCFSYLVFAVLGVVAGAGDGVNWLDGAGMLKEDTLKVFNCFFGVETMKIHVSFAAGRTVSISLFIELAGCLAVGFPHKVVLALTAKAQSFGSPGIVSVPCLGSTMGVISKCMVGYKFDSLTFEGTCSSSRHA
jgi:hypothetical protein